MFGGYNEEQGHMNDVYIIDLQSMVCELMLTAGTAYDVVHRVLYIFITEPRQTCMSVAWAHTCVSGLCKLFVVS